MSVEVIHSPNTVEVISTNVAKVVTSTPEINVVTAAKQGIPGRDGDETTGNVNRSALEDISGHVIVIAQTGGVEIADPNDSSHMGKVVGITTHAATSGNTIEVKTDGLMDSVTWSWTPGELYLGTSGSITQTAPTTGVFLVIGIAISSTQIKIEIQDAIWR